MLPAEPAAAVAWSHRPTAHLGESLAGVSRQDPRELFRIAAEALARYKLRTALSVLGVILGVAAVIAMMSVSEGARREALAQVEALGLDNLVARNRMMTAGEPGGSSGLTVAEADDLASLIPGATLVSPLIERVVPIRHASQSSTAHVLGIRPGYQDILHLRLSHGRFLSAVDERDAARVGVIGATLARQLFATRDPVGQFVRVRDEYYQVIGRLTEHGTESSTAGALAWRDLNSSLLVPLPALSNQGIEVSPGQRVDEIWVQADGDRIEATGRILGTTLEKLHGGRRDVDIVVPRELLAQRYRTQQTFSVVVGSIAAIALLIGGIGIMNIMLTSVVERTHEIGIRRTVGATRSDVTRQFLTESLLMTLAGGLLGVVIGVASAIGITAYAGWATHVSVVAVVLGIIVSLSVGLVFGLYPAMKAARLEPVDALRYE